MVGLLTVFFYFPEIATKVKVDACGGPNGLAQNMKMMYKVYYNMEPHPLAVSVRVVILEALETGKLSPPWARKPAKNNMGSGGAPLDVKIIFQA